MKKTNKRTDGTEEVLEGDPEELRKYEDLQKAPEQAPITESPKKPGILHGAPELDGKPLTDSEIEMIRFLRNFKLPEQKFSPIQERWYPQYPDPIWITYCSTCGRTNCGGQCWNLRPYPWITYTTVTGNEIKLHQQEPERASLLIQQDGSSKMSHSLTDFLLGRATLEVKTNGN